MSAALLPALRGNFLLFVLAFAAATIAFGTVMLILPPTSEAAVSDVMDDGIIPTVTNCEYLPANNSYSCTVYR